MAIVRDIMTKGVITVGMDDTVRTIQEIFRRKRFHHVVVVSGGQALGVISDRDLMKTISPFIGAMSERPQDRATLNRKAHQVMSRDLVFVHEEARITDASRMMVSCGVSCLPVLDDERSIRGIVTWRDILAWLVNEEGGEKIAPRAA